MAYDLRDALVQIGLAVETAAALASLALAPFDTSAALGVHRWPG